MAWVLWQSDQPLGMMFRETWRPVGSFESMEEGRAEALAKAEAILEDAEQQSAGFFTGRVVTKTELGATATLSRASQVPSGQSARHIRLDDGGHITIFEVWHSSVNLNHIKERR